ncbi:MAG: sulfatase-like hydrolase/transferase [Leadbetterella sp.]
MKKYFVLFFFVLFLSQSVFSQQRPNIVLILADDLRQDALGCYGNTYVKTPNIDALSKSGTRCTQTYILGGDQPAVCSPSRAMLLSGKNYFRISNKIKDQQTLPKLLKSRGYNTYCTGKWHNEVEALADGFTAAKNIYVGGMNDHFNTEMQDLLPNGKLSEAKKKGYSTDIFTVTAIDFLNDHPSNKPFFLYLPFTAPHDPRSPKEEYIGMYKSNEIPVPPNFMDLHPFDFGYKMNTRDESLSSFPRKPQDIQSQIADYYALISHFDESVGRILQKLKEKGFDKNTIVVFAADNGLALGSHGLMGKQNMYEHSMKVPLIFSGPGIPRHSTMDGFSYLFDIFPTLCSFVKIPVPKDLDGIGLNSQLLGSKKPIRSEIMTGYMDYQRSIRDQRYKLMVFPKVNHRVLFDLKSDPYELVNLAENPAYKQIVDDLIVKMKVNQKKFGDNQELESANPLPKEWDYSQFKRSPDIHQPKYILDKYFK